MENIKVVFDLLAQPKGFALMGALTLIIGSLAKNEKACTAGLLIIAVAAIWGA